MSVFIIIFRKFVRNYFEFILKSVLVDELEGGRWGKSFSKDENAKRENCTSSKFTLEKKTLLKLSMSTLMGSLKMKR